MMSCCHVPLDPHDPFPLDAQLKPVLNTEIAQELFPIGSQLPSEDELISRFQVSRTTLRRAIQDLAANGAVEIRRGKGTFVHPPKLNPKLTELSGFVEDRLALGLNPSARLLDRRLVEADLAVAQHLAVQSGTLVVRIHRIRLADQVPISFDETYLPRELGKRIVTEDLEKEPIFALLEQKYGTPLLEAEYRLEAVAAHESVSNALGLGLHAPVFLIERTSFTTEHCPVDFERLYYRGDKVQFTTKLARKQVSNRETSQPEPDPC